MKPSRPLIAILRGLTPAEALRITLEPGSEEDARTARLSGWDDRMKDLAA